MPEVKVENVKFEHIDAVLQKIEDEIISGTSAGFGLPQEEKRRTYEEIKGGFRDYVDVFLSNVDNNTVQYLRGLCRGDGEGNSSHYVIGEHIKGEQLGLFLCYKAGADSVGTVKNLEIGGFDGKYTEEIWEKICGRKLFDDSFNHILATPNKPTLKVCRPELPSAGVVESLYKQLSKKTREPLIQRIATYFS